MDTTTTNAPTIQDAIESRDPSRSRHLRVALSTRADGALHAGCDSEITDPLRLTPARSEATCRKCLQLATGAPRKAVAAAVQKIVHLTGGSDQLSTCGTPLTVGHAATSTRSLVTCRKCLVPAKPRSAAGKKAAATRAANKEKRIAAATRMAAKASPKAAKKAKKAAPAKRHAAEDARTVPSHVHLFNGCGVISPGSTSIEHVTCPKCLESPDGRRLAAQAKADASAKVVAFQRLYKGEIDVDYLGQLLTCSAQGEVLVPKKGWEPVEGDYTITEAEASELGQLLRLQGEIVRRAQALYERVRVAAGEAVSS